MSTDLHRAYSELQSTIHRHEEMARKAREANAPDYTGTPHAEQQNAIKIAELCLAAGKPERIVGMLRAGRNAKDVAAQLLADVAPPPKAAVAPAAAASSVATISEQLAAAAERRFRAQNARG